MTDFRFYAACLASYNNGRLHGAWINASMDADAMQAEVSAMLRASPFPNVTVQHPDTGESVPSAEEWAVHDYNGAWPANLGEFPGLALIASWAEVLDAADDAGIPADIAAKVAENYGEPHNGEFSETLKCLTDRYCGEHDSLTDYAESYIADTGMLDGVNSTIANYFDFEAFGRDLQLGGDVFTIRTDGGLHVFRSC